MSSDLSADGLSSAGAVADPESLLPLRRLAYTVLPPAMGRRRRSRLADSLARQALLLGESRMTARAHLIREVLHAGRRGGWVPGALAQLGERRTAESRATDKALGAMVPATRAAFGLLHLENLSPAQAIALLDLAGVQDPATPVALAERNLLDPEAIRAIVVPAPAAAVPQRLVVGAAAGLVLMVAAPVVAVSAFSSDSEDTRRVSNSSRINSEREAAKSAAKSVLDARGRAAGADMTAEMEQSFARILRKLNDSLDDPGLSHKAERRLRTLKAAIIAERDRLRN